VPERIRSVGFSEVANSSPYTIILLALTLFTASKVQAADGQGQFAVRGVGLISCGIYAQEYQAKEDVYLITAAWVDGYVTAVNEHAADTYDLLSFETTELIMAIVDRYCQANPTDTVFAVLTNLFKKLQQERIIEKSDKAAIVLDGRSAHHYIELIKRVQKKLKEDGLYHGDIHGEFNQQMIEALKRFQQLIGFEPTGFPDQATLWRLLRGE
jgi:murein L,D-transpeptidase YcbB/YkuD